MPASLADFRAPAWLPGGNLQTIWPALFAKRRRGPPLAFRRERWDTPDGDFVDVDHIDAADVATRPRLVLFHGLEGSSASHYVQAFADLARRLGFALAVPHFRGCSGEMNRAPRAYHSGDHEEVGWMLSRLRERSAAPMHAVGVSLGGNALLRWAEEAGESAATIVSAVASVSAPLDLAAAGRAIDQGFNRVVYARRFLDTMKPKALAQWERHPGLFDRDRIARAATIYAFDDAYTAPLHGFRGADDYWERASAGPHLNRIRVPALVVNARNDPFVPARSLPPPGSGGPMVELWQPDHGGHVGFPSGRWPGHVFSMPEAVLAWLARAG